MQTSRRKRKKCITRLNVFSREKFFAFDSTNNKAREIVFARRIETGHLRCFAADKRAARFAAGAAHPFDKLLDHLRFELPHREIVEKKKRLGALHKNVVDAVIDEIA